MKNSKINSISELQAELSRVYSNSDEETLQEFLSSQPPVYPESSRLHRVDGCRECPYAQNDVCYWDGSGSDISSYTSSSGQPQQCPLLATAIITQLAGPKGPTGPQGQQPTKSTKSTKSNKNNPDDGWGPI